MYDFIKGAKWEVKRLDYEDQYICYLAAIYKITNTNLFLIEKYVYQESEGFDPDCKIFEKEIYINDNIDEKEIDIDLKIICDKTKLVSTYYGFDLEKDYREVFLNNDSKCIRKWLKNYLDVYTFLTFINKEEFDEHFDLLIKMLKCGSDYYEFEMLTKDEIPNSQVQKE